jgi:DNA-binding NarL/FixJ family response regulator
MSTETKIIIADDHPIFRKGLRLVIEDAGMQVLAEADDGEEALTLIRKLAPDVAVIDVDMPKLDGFKLARRLRDEKVPVEIVFLTMHKDEDIFNAALDVGVRGYVVKDSAAADIASCIRAVLAGGHYISPSVSSHLMKRTERSTALRRERPGLDKLTPTERLVLRLIAESKTSREIADEMSISPRTVETHRTNISTKLELRGSHALLKFAYEHKAELS